MASSSSNARSSGHSSSSSSLAELREKSAVRIEPSFSVRSWINTARKTYEFAEKADRDGDAEAAYVGYRKMANLMKAIIEHKEYPAMAKQNPKPTEWFGYADLKAKVGPATQRVRAIEEILIKRDSERSSTSLNSVSNAVDDIAAIGPHDTPNGHSHVQGGPLPPSMKPNKPAPAAKPAHLTSAAGHTPTSPSSSSSNSGVGRPGRISGNLAARMAALHNAGMEGAGEYVGLSPSAAASSSSTTNASTTTTSADVTPVAGTSGLKRSPAIHHVSSISADSTSKYRRPISTTTSPANSFDSDLPLPKQNGAASQHDVGSGPATSTSRQQQEHVASPPAADDPSIAALERPDSAPPAVENGPPNASGPATTSHDFLSNPVTATGSSSSRARSGSGANDASIEARLAAPQPPSTSARNTTSATAEADLDDFSSRFPDVDQENFDILPSAPAFRPGEQHSHFSSRPDGPSSSQIPKPFHPAPQSTFESTGFSSSGRKSSLSSSTTEGSFPNGYSAAQGKAGTPPPVVASKPHRPPLPKPPSAPSLPNLDAKTISPSDLWSYLDQPTARTSILLIDVRTRHAFTSGRIKGKNVVCLEPFTLSSNSTAASIEVSLEISPPQEKEWFSDRANFDLIVVYDRNTRQLPSRSANGVTGRPTLPLTFGSTNSQSNGGEVSQDSKALAILLSAIYEFNFSDQGKRLKRSPLLLVGGFEAWEKEIGEKGIQRDQTQGHGHSHKLSQSGSGERPPSMSAKEAEYQAMLLNRGRSDSGSADHTVSSDIKRQHRKAVVSGDGLIAPIAPALPRRQPHLDQSHHAPPTPPPPAYSHNGPITVPPVAVHRTGPASPYEAYPSTSFRGADYSGGEYFRGSPAFSPSASTQHPPSMGMAMSGYNASQPPFPPSRPVDYPNLQQRHRVQNGSPSRPTPPTFPNAPSGQVQIPQPVLSRPPSSSYADGPQHTSRPSLQLLQNASYLKSPAFGAFPTQLMSLGDGLVGLTGLKNLGNTCYMNSMVQCLSATIPLASFLRKGSYKKAINTTNVLGTKGVLADAVAQLVQTLWAQQYSFLAPVTFRDAICRFAPQFKGSDQHDSQEFLAFLLDGLHEDLNLVIDKPKPVEFTPEREAELEVLPTQIAAEREWNIYLRRDDSIIVRLFQGQYKSQLKCLTCGATSTTYNTFMYLSLPVPSGKGISKVTLGQCIDYFTKPEILEGDDAWNCTKCKKPRRAMKALTISRLPPILLIHLKRFSFHGPFTDKIDTSVIFPVTGLDLTRYMPSPLDPGIEKQYASAVGGAGLEKTPPPIYDLHAISNHFGSLSSGHYTAYIKSRGTWHDLNDSKIGKITEAQVASANKSAYTLWYSLSPASQAVAESGRLVELR